MNDEIKQIIKIAVNAPSGDNAQPWRFEVKGNTINLYNIPDADNTLYNFQNRGDYIAHGAVLENISIASRNLGYEASFNLFPSYSDPNLTATITLAKTGGGGHPLFPQIEKRATNRRKYKPDPLPTKNLEDFQNIISDIPGIKIVLITDRDKINDLAKALSLNERLILENKTIHDGLFSYIRWTPEEEQQKLNGMYIKTLELAPPQEHAFKLFRKWSLINFLGKLGVPKLVAKDNVKLYASSAAFCLIIAADASPQALVSAGRAMQRIWLKATSMGLAIQPTAALLYLAQRINSGDTKYFSRTHTELIKTAESQIKKIFATTDEGMPAMMIRLGYADPPTARSLKRTPQITES